MSLRLIEVILRTIFDIPFQDIYEISNEYSRRYNFVSPLEVKIIILIIDLSEHVLLD